MSSEKVSPQLTASLKQTGEEGLVDLIVELADPPATKTDTDERTHQIAARKEAFSKHAEPVAEQIRRMGGEVTDQAWINSSMRARVSKKMIAALSEAPQVKRLDLPRAIKADTSG